MFKRGECKKKQVADDEKPHFSEHAKLQVVQMHTEGVIISAAAACSRRERCIGERLGKKRALAHERMREMSVRRASDRAAVIAVSTIDVDEMGTYMGVKKSSWRHACATVYSWLKKISNQWRRKSGTHEAAMASGSYRWGAADCP